MGIPFKFPFDSLKNNFDVLVIEKPVDYGIITL